MTRVLRRSWFRFAGSLRLALPALIVLLGVGGYLVTSATIRSDRDAAAARRAQVESVRTQGVLGRARAYVAGLGNVLAGEPAPGQRRFARLAGGAASSVGLVDVFWVERVPDSERKRYERRLGAPITRLTRAGRFAPAPPAAAYLPMTFTSRTRRELRPGVDVSGWRGVAAAIRNRASVFAVSASDPGSLGAEPGFYLLETSSFGRGLDSRGFLVVFVPRGWLTASLEDDPRRVAVNLDGRRLEGGLAAAPAASGGFEALARRWRIDVGSEPPSGLQSLLPWLALAWPIAVALLVLLVGRGIVRRRRAERELERFFDLSLDLLCIAGLDGYFKQVNPAFERTLGYPSQELLARPFSDFVHPADRARTREALDELSRGRAVVEFENRYLCSDGSERWLQWSTRPMPDEGLLYAAARDVTDRRRAEDQLREAQRTVEASRDELRLLAEEQAALRRVATLVARAVSPTEVFGAVAAEAGRLLGAPSTRLERYEPDGAATVVAGWSEPGVEIPVGSEEGARSAVGAPIAVEGRLWGALIAAWTRQEAVPADAEDRMAEFTNLVATAIANADSGAKLTASRARIVATADETRRRIERDLHDGTQQRLVSLGLELRAAEEAVPPELNELKARLSDTANGLAGAAEELQEISRGIHPAILSTGGLAPALKTLARRSAVPVELDVRADRRLPERVEVAAYYVVSEALTNAAKHAHASVVHVDLEAEDSIVQLAIRDDGVGGADPARGSGLIGLSDRVEALGGRIEIASPTGRGTSLLVRIPTEGD